VLPAYAAPEGDWEYELLPDNTVEITAYFGDDEVLVIPGTLGGYPVSSIGEGAFERNIYIERVTIPSSVTSIGDSAFEDCRYLESVNIPDGVISIGKWAFAFCDDLESITIPNSVTDIGLGAFRGCSLAGGVQLGNKLKHISEEAFKDCDMLSLTIPEGVTSIGESAFESCRDLARVSLPESLTTIEDYAFGNCRSLDRIVFPAGVSYIGDSAFQNCRFEIYFLGPPPDGITPWTFHQGGFGSYSTLYYPIDFETEWTIRGPFEEEPTWWPDEYPPDEYPYWDGYPIRVGHPFAGDYQYRILPDGTAEIVSYIGAGGDLVIPNKIEGYSVTGIGPNAFLYYDNLTGVIIPDGMTYIGEWAFYRCEDMTSIKIPDSVLTIGEYAFVECFSLTDITLPDKITRIEEGTFSWCDSLTGITIPSGVTYIGEDAFAYCEKLQEVYFLGLPPEDVGSDAFETYNEETVLYYPAGLADYWAPNSETTWHGYKIMPDDPTLRIVPGDADCNGVVNAADAAAILRHLVQLKPLSKQSLLNAKVTLPLDRPVSAADAARILRWLVELEKNLVG